MLVVKVLGAAAGGGFPQWNANSAACRRARSGDPAAPVATQASIAVSVDERHWYLTNASPDLRQQIEADRALHPAEGLRSSPIAGVILTNGDVDAIAGLLHLREGTAFSLYANTAVMSILDANPIFNVLAPEFVPRRLLREDEWQPVRDAGGGESGLSVKSFRVPGKVPLYLEEADDIATAAEDGNTLGLEFRADGCGFFYVANCAAITAALAERITGCDLLFFDGTLFSDDEMIRQNAGSKTGRRMGHMSLSGECGSMAQLAPLDIKRTIFIHINNTNPILLSDSPKRREVEEAGFEVAYDGMEIRL